MLDNNKIKNIFIFSESLKINNSLTKLNLNNNKIINIDKLKECLKFNNSLKKISINKNIPMMKILEK